MKKWGFLTLQRVTIASASSWTEAYCLTTASVKKELRHIASVKKNQIMSQRSGQNIFLAICLG